MGIVQRVYSDEQLEALEQAWGDRNIRPARRVVELAAAGELTASGDPVAPFTVPEPTVRTIGNRYVRRREGKARSDLAALPPKDSIEAMRRRLVNVIDGQLSHLERQQRGSKHERVNGALIREIARALREISALPGPSGEPAQSKPPGHFDTAKGKNDGGPTRGGLAGQIIRASQPRPIAARDDVSTQDSEDGASAAAHTENNGEGIAGGDGESERINVPDGARESEDPGEYARAHIAGLQGVRSA